jgi:hypothetical protein
MQATTVELIYALWWPGDASRDAETHLLYIHFWEECKIWATEFGVSHSELPTPTV